MFRWPTVNPMETLLNLNSGELKIIMEANFQNGTKL